MHEVSILFMKYIFGGLLVAGLGFQYFDLKFVSGLLFFVAVLLFAILAIEQHWQGFNHDLDVLDNECLDD